MEKIRSSQSGGNHRPFGRLRRLWSNRTQPDGNPHPEIHAGQTLSRPQEHEGTEHTSTGIATGWTKRAISPVRSVTRTSFTFETSCPTSDTINPRLGPTWGKSAMSSTALTDRKKMTSAQWHFAGPTRPLEELYDCRKDPQNLNQPCQIGRSQKGSRPPSQRARQARPPDS